MTTTFRLPRALTAAALVAAAVLATAPLAFAHAGIESASPANGAQLPSAPQAVTLAFEETIKLDGTSTRLIDGRGTTVPATVKAKGHKVTLTPRSPLASGRYAAAWHLISSDGDAVEGAVTFTVGTPNPTGSAQHVVTKPSIPATIDAALPGSRTLTLVTRGTTGDIVWTSARLPEGVTWRVKGNGRKATGTGVLPWGGVWSFTATVTDRASHVLVVKGSVSLANS